MTVRTRTPRPSPPPGAPRQMPPLGWIIVAGLLVILVFAYSSWRGDWNGPMAAGAPSTAEAGASGQG